jgi:transcription elongation factor GreB
MPEDDVPERPQSPHPNYVTPQGLAMLREQHQQLLDKLSGLEANEADPLVQQQKQQLERDLNYINGRLERAIVVDPAGQPPGEVRFGAVVEVRDEESKAHEVTIVGEDEADVASGRVSWVSPLAQAMMGAQVGDVVMWQRPAGNSQLEIVAIRYPQS